MPFIHVRTSDKLTEAQAEELKSRLGETIGIISGKTEKMLMIHIEDGCRMYYQGEKGAALIDTMIAGHAPREDFDRHGEMVTQIFSEITGMPSERVYIKYGEMPYCGVDGRLK